MESRATGNGQQPFRPEGSRSIPQEQGTGVAPCTSYLFRCQVSTQQPVPLKFSRSNHISASRRASLCSLWQELQSSDGLPVYCSLSVSISYCPWFVLATLVSRLHLNYPGHFRHFMLAIPCLGWSSPKRHMGDVLLCICSAVAILLKSSTCPHSPLLVLLTPLFPCSISSLLSSLSNTLYHWLAGVLLRLFPSRNQTRDLCLCSWAVSHHYDNSKDAAVTQDGIHPCL